MTTPDSGVLLFVRSGACTARLLHPTGPHALCSGAEVDTLDPRDPDVGERLVELLDRAARVNAVTDAEADAGFARLSEALGPKVGTTARFKTWVVTHVVRHPDTVFVSAEMPARRADDRRPIREELPPDASAADIGAAFRRVIARGEQYIADHGFGDAERTFPEEPV